MEKAVGALLIFCFVFPVKLVNSTVYKLDAKLNAILFPSFNAEEMRPNTEKTISRKMKEKSNAIDALKTKAKCETKK